MRAERRIYRSAFEAATSTPAEPEKAPEAEAQSAYVGCFYIQNAIPLRNGEIKADGSTRYMLKTYRIAEGMTPGELRNGSLLAQPEYLIYEGHICNKKGDPGFTVGYVYNLFSRSSVDTMESPLIDKTVGTLMPTPAHLRPESSGTWDFGNYSSLIQNFDESIETARQIAEKRISKPTSVRHQSIIGGAMRPA